MTGIVRGVIEIWGTGEAHISKTLTLLFYDFLFEVFVRDFLFDVFVRFQIRGFRLFHRILILNLNKLQGLSAYSRLGQSTYNLRSVSVDPTSVAGN